MLRIFCFLLVIISNVSFAKSGETEKDKLLQSARSEIVLSPDRSLEVLEYIEKNFKLEKLDLDQLNYLKIKALFFQNNLTDVLKLISKKDDELPDDIIILKKSILYSLNIANDFSNENQNNDYVVCKKIMELLVSDKNHNGAIESAKLQSILKDIKTANVNLQREPLFYLCAHLSRTNDSLRYEKFLNEIKNIFKNDYAFEILSAKYLLINDKTETASEIIEKLPKEALEQSTNLNLKYQYYDLLVNLYSKTNQPDAYKSAVEKKESLFRNIDRTVFSARNKWFTTIEEGFKNDIHTSIKKNHSILWAAGGFSLILILFILFRLSQFNSQIKEYENFIFKLSQNKDKKTIQTQIISEKTEKILLQKLDHFEKTSDFTNADISLQNLAKKLDTNTKYLSEIINKHKQKNFNNYINELRIFYITNKLKENPVYRNYKIKYLAEESGFSTHSAFAATFKSVKGISPANYIKLLNHKEE